eukprot:TRINITY_DN39390_c0_g1_i1.p1 TRINITY_DN39390_c0_g1~~TRINITY_DN39390_c0_g1_i1.p1  ORF type:complete len:281 (-),score=80.67 TRINITY_DN39390_c0_g1_i1:37-879(-)
MLWRPTGRAHMKSHRTRRRMCLRTGESSLESAHTLHSNWWIRATTAMQMGHMTTSHFMQDDGPEMISLEADESVSDLGLELTPLLKDKRVYILVVKDGLWADDNLLQVGDELEKVQGSFLFEIFSTEDLLRRLEERPLELQFSRDPKAPTRKLSHLQQLVAEVTKDASADTTTKKKKGPEEIPLFAYDGDGSLGFKTNGSPPAESVVIKKLDPQGMAAVSGLKVGDELITINEKNITKFDDARLKKALEKRPLKLVFQRGGKKKKKKEEDAGFLGGGLFG